MVIKMFNFLSKPQYQHACSPRYSPYVSYGTSWENFFKHQDCLSLVSIFFILIVCMFEHLVVILYEGKVRYWSLLGVKGLMESFLVSQVSCTKFVSMRKQGKHAEPNTHLCCQQGNVSSQCLPWLVFAAPPCKLSVRTSNTTCYTSSSQANEAFYLGVFLAFMYLLASSYDRYYR